MVPLRDNNPIEITPFVTYALIVVNIGVFLHEMTLSPQQLERFLDLWAVVPRELTRSLANGANVQAVPEWFTLFSSQFLHGGILHIAGNMLFLWIFGNNIEDRLGHVKYLVFYLACGALAALTQWWFSASSAVPSLGASGAIAGIMGAYILRFPSARITTFIPFGFIPLFIPVPAVFFLGFWFLQQAFYGLVSLDASMNIGMEGGGIAYWAHAGGFVFGAILGPLLGLFSNQHSR